MPPILSIVGKSNVGKTTLLEKLIAELKRRGYRLATVKHDVHGFDMDQPGKDSWRHAQAGADAVVVSSPQKLALLQKTDHDASLDELARLLGESYDLILTEGYKQSSAPKIEVHRKAAGQGGLLCSPQELVAVATDEPLEALVPQFSLEDAAGLASLIEERFLSRPRQEWTTLYVNGAQIPLTPFVQEILRETTLGLVSTLRGVDRVETLELSFRRKP